VGAPEVAGERDLEDAPLRSVSGLVPFHGDLVDGPFAVPPRTLESISRDRRSGTAAIPAA
jgi:hypothetical protein